MCKQLPMRALMVLGRFVTLRSALVSTWNCWKPYMNVNGTFACAFELNSSNIATGQVLCSNPLHLNWSSATYVDSCGADLTQEICAEIIWPRGSASLSCPPLHCPQGICEEDFEHALQFARFLLCCSRQKNEGRELASSPLDELLHLVQILLLMPVNVAGNVVIMSCPPTHGGVRGLGKGVHCEKATQCSRPHRVITG